MIDEENSSPREPRWEVIEHGWRAVVLDMETSPQFTAFIKYVGAAYWRVWAGRLFDTLEDAKAWCRAEIAHQLQKSGIEIPPKPWAKDPPAWQWLWDTLCDKLGEDQTAEIRTGLLGRLHQEELKS